MTWTDNNMGELRSGCGRFVIYALPEGFVCIDRTVGLEPSDMSDPYPTAGEAQAWAERRAG